LLGALLSARFLAQSHLAPDDVRLRSYLSLRIPFVVKLLGMMEDGFEPRRICWEQMRSMIFASGYSLCENSTKSLPTS
jgi:hypothetical protein